MNRKPGYYWCRVDPQAVWEVGYWDGSEWECCGDRRQYTDKVWFEINETQIQPPNN